MLSIMYAHGVQTLKTTRLFPFSMSMNWLLRGHNDIASLMPPIPIEIDSYLAYRLRIIHKVSILKHIVDQNSEKAQTRYNGDYDTHVQFALHFAAGENLFVGRLSLTASRADGMIYK